MELALITLLYNEYKAAVAALDTAVQNRKNNSLLIEPKLPPFIDSDATIELYKRQMEDYIEAKNQVERDIKTLEAVVRSTKDNLFFALPPHVWMLVGKGMWIAKQLSDWPQAPPELLERTENDPYNLPQLKMIHVSTN